MLPHLLSISFALSLIQYLSSNAYHVPRGRYVKSRLRANACTRRCRRDSASDACLRQTSAETVRVRAFSHRAPTNLTLLHTVKRSTDIYASSFANSFFVPTLFHPAKGYTPALLPRSDFSVTPRRVSISRSQRSVPFAWPHASTLRTENRLGKPCSYIRNKGIRDT